MRDGSNMNYYNSSRRQKAHEHTRPYANLIRHIAQQTSSRGFPPNAHSRKETKKGAKKTHSKITEYYKQRASFICMHYFVQPSSPLSYFWNYYCCCCVLEVYNLVRPLCTYLRKMIIVKGIDRKPVRTSSLSLRITTNRVCLYISTFNTRGPYIFRHRVVLQLIQLHHITYNTQKKLSTSSAPAKMIGCTIGSVVGR